MALSWREPFASLMLKGKIETRTWPTKYRGLVLICASKMPYSLNALNEICGFQQLMKVMDFVPNIRFSETNGHAIAIGRLIDCRPMTPDNEDKCLVRYHPDLFCHVYEDVLPIRPIPWKGTQGWKEVSEDFKQLIRFI